MDTQLQFRHDEAARRYLAEAGGVEVAFSEVDAIGADALLIKHTEVPTAHEGKGYGSALMRSLLDYARSKGKVVIPVCPFAAGWLRKHPEYHDVLKPGYPI